MCRKGTVGVVKCISQGLGKPSLIVSKMKLGKPKSLLVMNPGCQQPRSCSNRYKMKKQNKTETKTNSKTIKMHTFVICRVFSLENKLIAFLSKGLHNFPFGAAFFLFFFFFVSSFFTFFFCHAFLIDNSCERNLCNN